MGSRGPRGERGVPGRWPPLRAVPSRIPAGSALLRGAALGLTQRRPLRARGCGASRGRENRWGLGGVCWFYVVLRRASEPGECSLGTESCIISVIDQLLWVSAVNCCFFSTSDTLC